MPRTVFCTYLQREAEGLERVPYPGELGKRIYDNVSAEAWRAWVGHQTMLINEYRLSPIEPKARKFLVEEMEKLMLTNLPATDDDVLQLALRRAENVQSWLIDEGKVPPERIFLVEPKTEAGEKGKASRVDFSLR